MKQLCENTENIQQASSRCICPEFHYLTMFRKIFNLVLRECVIHVIHNYDGPHANTQLSKNYFDRFVGKNPPLNLKVTHSKMKIPQYQREAPIFFWKSL